MKTYPKGIRAFSPNAKAPEFVKAQIVISINDLVQFAKDNQNLLTEYNGQKQLKLNMLSGDKGLYLVVDEYKPSEKKEKSNLPF